MAIATDGLTIVAATPFEAAAIRREVRSRVPVVTSGIALRGRNAHFDGTIISCGLAGGLRRAMPTGTVLVPRAVRRPDGTTFACDPDVFGKLWVAATSLGLQPVDAPLLTHTEIVRGPGRARWEAEGYAGADMETGLLFADRIACVRVVLDTPESELSAAWENPSRALLSWRAWLDLPFFIAQAPRCAALAARVVATALV